MTATPSAPLAPDVVVAKARELAVHTAAARESFAKAHALAVELAADNALDKVPRLVYGLRQEAAGFLSNDGEVFNIGEGLDEAVKTADGIAALAELAARGKEATS